MPQRNGRTLNLVTLGVSIVALLLAGYAVLRQPATVDAGPASAAVPTNTPPSATLAGASSTDSPGSTETTESPSTTASDTAGGGSDPNATPPLPTVGYTVSYQDKHLRLTPNNGCNYRYVDLDQPAVVASSPAADVSFLPCSGSSANAAQLIFPNQSVAQVPSTNAGPEDCANAITSSPASQRITLSRQLTLCTVTDGTSTPDQPARQRMVRIVTDNIGQDGTTDLTVSAWEVPR